MGLKSLSHVRPLKNLREATSRRENDAVRPKGVIRALRRGGFIVHHVTGSHYFLKRGLRRVSVPYHNKDLKPGTLHSIIAQAGLTIEEFKKLL